MISGPRWFADGILFVRFDGELAQLWGMRANGTDKRLMVDDLAAAG
jgi:hypothetical protein